MPGWRSSYSIPRGLPEYLIASEIVLFLEDIEAESARHAGNSRRGWSPTEQLHRWAGLFGPAPLSADLVHQVLDILRQRARHPRDELAYACREPLSRLIGVVLTHDFPRAAMPPGESLAECLAWSRNAGEALLVLTSACAEVSGARAHIEEPAPGSFGNWLRRLQPQRVGRETSLSLAHLRRLDLSEVRLPLADLHGANFKQTDLAYADLDGANLEKADLTAAKLARADLVGACLVDAIMHTVDLTEARLDEVDANGIDLSEALMVEACLSSARLAGADLADAALTSADLSNADLSHADLSRAICIGANFSGADLTGANLTMADLEGANLSDAVLSTANLRFTKLAEASCNAGTRWPAGFDHRRAGVEES
ncbi:MAG: pentapeptide repeat-containing protein [bacterium]